LIVRVRAELEGEGKGDGGLLVGKPRNLLNRKRK
jgi:hypothetical protein